MPDVIPSETYVHHTLQRSLQIPQILSPVITPPPKLMTMGTPFYYMDGCGTFDEHQKLLNSNDIVDSTSKANNTMLNHSKHYETYSGSPIRQITDQIPGYRYTQPYHYYQSATLKPDFANGMSSHYANYSTPECYNTNQTPSSKGSGSQILSSSSTLCRNNSLKYSDIHTENITNNKGSISKNGTLKFGTTIDDEMNDAYYTYTAKKTTRAPATTFN